MDSDFLNYLLIVGVSSFHFVILLVLRSSCILESSSFKILLHFCNFCVFKIISRKSPEK